ncbi:unnamed protein product [Penicillium salamii]|uniref:FAD dependent oxidoreductase domain-containing protein n=1 Tax=Penicillium salamii TaxID=1612424 RepID=A0A9W4NR00_9EURO|nr:unnamed protein product [Penicillium salamii]CAG8140362.1 unnamed protein product [Penicillium salamii]CAG8157279.1 unnamed protein product [Penicillium salamii]CAG8159455.1 unnamed protein product [Penicillium salamii]CAG8259287.1 unnamed protein product [Penicillium salamii]
MTIERFDVAVVGLGALGSGAAYQAAVKGARVIGFEQIELAYKDWAELERRSGLRMLNITGGVVFLPRNGLTPSSNFTKSLDANGVPYELLDSREVTSAGLGIAHASKSVTTTQYQARANDAVLRESTRVDRIIPDGNGVVIGNGHAFKFTPAIDRVVVELAMDGNTSDNISKLPI